VWVEAGHDDARFWSLTLREISIILDGSIARRRREQNDLAWLAWHVAAFQRVKKMPKLKDILISEPKKASPVRRPVSVDEVRSWLSKGKR
jgi:hypothetical protein